MTAARPGRRTSPQTKCIKLADALRLNACAQLQEQLVARLDKGGSTPIELDGGAVDSVDTAALQLLLVFARECARRDIAWHWKRVSEPLRQGSASLGLDSLLAIPAAPAN